MPHFRYSWLIAELFWLLVWLLLSSRSAAQESFAPQYHPTLSVPRLAGQITIDGDLGEPGWQLAGVADHFCETNPGDQIKPPVESKALVTYDQSHLYVALIAYDDPATIRANWSDRDAIFANDYFGIMLDTYGDASWGYELFVNPLGIQGDLRMLANGNEEMGFDIVWESRGKVTDSGYQVEIAIPFSSLRFPNKPEQVWRCTFWRDHQRDVRRKYTWSAQNRDEACFMCQWGTLTGIRDIRPSTNLDLLPAVVGYEAGQLQDMENPKSPFESGDPDADLGLNARYGLSSNASVELALNPDFSQVESDATQIDVNSAEALFFGERRPFFQEGSDLYDLSITTVHTRTIVNPAVAGKFTARVDRSNVGYFIARDDNSSVVIPREERTFFGDGTRKSTVQVFRAKQTFKEDSYIGAVATDRRLEGSAANTVLGGDLQYRFTRNYRVRLTALASRTDESNDGAITADADTVTFERGKHTLAYDGETYWGHALRTTFVRDGRVWNANVALTELSPTYRADNGFITRNDRRSIDGWTGLTYRVNKRALTYWEPSISFGRVWNFNDIRKDEWLVANISFATVGPTEVGIEYLVSRELFRNVWFPGIRRLSMGFESRLSGSLYLQGDGEIGRFIARGGQLQVPILGKGGGMELGASVKPTSRLSLAPSLEYSWLDFPDSGNAIFDVYVARTRINYQFSREWFLRVVVEYVNGSDYDGEGTYEKESFVTIEPLLSYKLNPFTIFYIGSTHDYWDKGQTGDYHRRSQRFFAKLQYLFRA